MKIIEEFFAKLFAKQIGVDELGNKYYLTRSKKRIVMYAGPIVEASNIPPMFHAWLNYVIDEFPCKNKKYKWQLPHIANKTGTAGAYVAKSSNTKAQKHYVAWQPS